LLLDMLWLDVDRQAGNNYTGYVIRFDPIWQIWGPGGVLIGSDFWRTFGAREAEACERAAEPLLGHLIGEPVTGLEVKPRSNALAVEVGGRFLVQTFLRDPTDQDSWSIDNRGRRVKVEGSAGGLKVVRRHRSEERPTSRVRRQKPELHALDDDGLVLCNP